MKHLTKENWLETDPNSARYIHLNTETLETKDLFPDHFVEIVMDINLSENIPSDLHGLYNTARGAMLYGYFFYPLFALGTQQLFRLCEAAISDRYLNAGGPPKRRDGRFHYLTFKIDWLFKNGIINEAQQQYFHMMREARNEASHPTFQTIQPPMMAAHLLTSISQEINALFEPQIDLRGSVDSA